MLSPSLQHCDGDYQQERRWEAEGEEQEDEVGRKSEGVERGGN